MARDPAAYLLDGLEACAAIEDVLRGIDLDCYKGSRAVRSAVEREFILIGEALKRLRWISPDTFSCIRQGQLIIDFRNLLAHDYRAVDDEVVYGIATGSLLALKEDLIGLLEEMGVSPE